jgi:hypothetical protein
MKLDEWLHTFPMRRTVRGKTTPGNSMAFRLFMRVQAGGNGYLMEKQSGSEPYPVANEERAVEVFRALWRRAQAEAPAKQASDDS